MKLAVFIIFVLLGLSARLVRRHGQRGAVMPTTIATSQRDDLRPVDHWQQGIILAPLGNDPASERLKQKLAKEEARQRPWEGRN